MTFLRAWSCAAVLALITAGALCAAEPAADPRKPLPAREALNQAVAQVKEVFKAEYAAAAPEALAALARKLLEQAQAEKDEVSKYALLSEARRLAVQAAEPLAAARAVADLGRAYRLDTYQETFASLDQCRRQIRDMEKVKELAGIYLGLGKTALEEELYAEAERAVQKAQECAAVARDAELAKLAAAQKGAVEQARRAFLQVQKARETLKTQPDDPAANLALGRFLWFTQGDAAKALPHLAKGSDGSLATCARLDLDGAPSNEAKVALGDAWWQQSEGKPPAEQDALRARAAHWYQQCVNELTGLEQMRVLKRIGDSGAQDSAWIEFAENETKGLRAEAMPPGDGKFQYGAKDGRPCGIFQAPTYLHLKLDDLWADNFANAHKMLVDVECYDDQGAFHLQYSTADKVFEIGGTATLEGKKTWAVKSLAMTNQKFRNAQNSGADLRIFFMKGGPIYVRKVTVRRASDK
ncbi:MAG: hypothetical protein M5U26_05340 [Planctomycetota bacterium]|nr:hypothetical protein [Planctomycetota bacterium]